MKTGLTWVAIVAAILCLGAGLVVGQNPNASNNAVIKGIVTDSDSKPVQGVRVSLLNTGGGTTSLANTTTNTKGEYTFSNVSPGTYTVTADLLGFQTARYSKLALTAKQTLELNFKLQDGAVSSPVELSLNPPKEEPKRAENVLPPLPPLPGEVDR